MLSKKLKNLSPQKIVFTIPESDLFSETMINERERPPYSNGSGSEKPTDNKTIEESFARLSLIQFSSAERVNKSRMDTEQREVTRRDDEASDNLKKNALVHQIEQAEDRNAVAAGWKECMSSTNAEDLFDLLNKQKALCEGVISKLENISKELGSLLSQKDHEYITALKRNRQEIETLQSCIEEEHDILKNAFETELKLIEESLNAEKNEILQERKVELDSLMMERNEAELQCFAHHHEIIRKQRLDILACDTTGDQEKIALKDKLEQDLKMLELQLENTRAHHQFETDKLEFDVRVLDELSDNNAEINKQKKRIMKGKEELYLRIEAKKREHERCAKENRILEDDCERIERQCNGLKEKFDRLKISDSEKFRSILALHQDELQTLQGELKRSQDFIFGGEIGC